MSRLERYSEKFCAASREHLQEELQEYGASLLTLSVSEGEKGIWATSVVSLPGLEEPWTFHGLVVEQAEAEGLDIADRAIDDAVILTTHLNELLATRPWPPPEGWPVVAEPMEERTPGDVEAWPGGPHVRDVDPRSLRAGNPEYLKGVYRATWRPLFEAICKDPWRALRPEFTEDATGIWLEVSMRCKAGGDERRWSHRGLILDAAGRRESPEAVGRRFVTQTIKDFERESRRGPLTG
ncbi:hypothetical protein [Streptosporangium sp. NPDC023615]|uniref:hypothetical protein n=1 Tax=Streptosporangium sp. NPDC023615 TaxID=3154794 RepID=UPI003427F2F5